MLRAMSPIVTTGVLSVGMSSLSGNTCGSLLQLRTKPPRLDPGDQANVLLLLGGLHNKPGPFKESSADSLAFNQHASAPDPG